MTAHHVLHALAIAAAGITIGGIISYLIGRRR